MIGIEFSLFAVILGAYALWVFGMYAAALMRSVTWHERDQLAETLRPQIRDALVDYLAGSEDRSRIREFLKLSRRDVGDGIVAFQATVGGASRDRLCELALEQALVHDWCEEGHSHDVVLRRTAFERLAFVSSNEPCRRVSGDMVANALEDRDSEVRFSAALGVLQTGQRHDVARVLAVAVSQNLLVRILLAEELRRYASLLCERAIPDILASEDYDAVLATLEMLNAWERALPLKNLSQVLSHPNRDIRLQALRLASLVPLTIDTQGAILDSLADPDPDIAIAACGCASRLHLEAAIPGLARCLRQGGAELVRVAAAALAELPPRGWTTLEELSASPGSIGADAAREALTRAREKAES